MVDSNVPAQRPKTGGRVKGSKNKTTLVKEALVNGFEEELKKDFNKVVRAVLDQAIDGCRQSQKMILDRVVPTVHAQSDKDDNKFSGGISIVIGSMEADTKVEVTPSVIADAEYEEIEVNVNEELNHEQEQAD